MSKRRVQAQELEDESRFPFERVVWVDSCEPGVNAEVEMDAVPPVQRIVQVGHLVKETETSLSIAGAWKPELRTFDYVITIPKVAVVRRERLSRPR
jgi:hypothetical protein